MAGIASDRTKSWALVPVALVALVLPLAPMRVSARPSTKAVSPKSAVESQFPVHRQIDAMKSSGDLFGAARELAESGATLRDPLLLIESGEIFLDIGARDRDIPTIDEARTQALLALDMLYFLGSDAVSRRWRPVEDGQLSILLDRTRAILARAELTRSEINDELSGVGGSEVGSELNSKERRPGFGWRLGGGMSIAIGIAAAGLGIAGLARGKNSQTAVEDPTVYASEHYAAEDTGLKANRMAGIGFSAAGIGVLLGMTFVLVGKKRANGATKSDHEARLSAAPTLSSSLRGLSLSGKF